MSNTERNFQNKWERNYDLAPGEAREGFGNLQLNLGP